MAVGDTVLRRLLPIEKHTPRVYRSMDRLYRSGQVVRAQAISGLWRMVTGIEVVPGAELGQDVTFVHGVGTVIGREAKIGDRTRILSGVTLGKIGGVNRPQGMPTVGSDVSIYAGSKVLGQITIGEHAEIGANAVVVKDVPAGAIVAGNPAKIIGWKDGFGADKGSAAR